MGPEALEGEIFIDAPPEIVFAFLVEPTRIVQWLGVEVELDPQPGGAIRIDVNNRDVVQGEIVELDPPRRIVYTWGWDRAGSTVPPGSTTVSIELEPAGEGTRLRLRHAGLPPEVADEHRIGWGHYLGRLTVAAAGGDPGPDPLGSDAIEHGEPGSAPPWLDG